MPMPLETSRLIRHPDRPALDEAVDILKRGGLVALPTETVYGLGADAGNPDAVKRLYAVKGRPGNHPVIVHLAGQEHLSAWASDIPKNAWRLAEAFWPGPLTLILPRASHVSDAVTGGQETVGLRVPGHPVALELLNAFGGGIAAPSANRFGRISPTTAVHVFADLGEDVDLILDGGACEVGVESTIVAFENGKPVILRPGMITAEQIEAALDAPLSESRQSATRAPGTLASHYAPKTPLQIVSSGELEELVQTDIQKTVGVLAYSSPPENFSALITWQKAPANAPDYARLLYALLREMDRLNVSRIWIEAVPESSEWAAVQDRLRRAAHVEGKN